MAKYANQYTIIVGPRLPRDAEHEYTKQSIEALQRAMVELKGETFKLWMYLSKNKDGVEWDLGPKACEAWGIKKDSYYKAKDILVEKGYLVQIEENRYEFCEIPVKSNEKLDDTEDTVKTAFDF